MPRIPPVPASCAGLDLALVERTLARHYGHISAAARELGVSAPDLRRLTRSKPELLEEAQIECLLFVNHVWGVLLEMLDSPDPRRRERAADKILSSWAALNHPLSPARR
jgi:Bacterial regulatory protein, Fis family